MSRRYDVLVVSGANLRRRKDGERRCGCCSLACCWLSVFCESFGLRVASLAMASSTGFVVTCHVSTSFSWGVVRTLRDGVLCG